MSPRTRTTLLLLALCGLLLLAALSALGYWQWLRYQNARADIEPRMARLAGLLGKQDELAKTLASARANTATHAWPASTDLAHAETAFQSQIRDLFQNAGINILGTHQLPTETLEQIDLLSVEITAHASLPQLLQVLQKRTSLQPLAHIDQLHLSPTLIPPLNAPEPAEQKMNVRIRFKTSHLRSSAP